MEQFKASMASLYSVVLREAESDAIQELPTNLYPSVTEYMGLLKQAEYDGTEARIKDELMGMTTRLVELLIQIRLEKATAREPADHTNLSDEEKYVISAAGEMQERRDLILSAVLNGKSKFLESVSEKYRTRLVAVRFVKKMDQFMGVDMEKYGPFEAESVSNLPYENAQALVLTGAAEKIRWED